MSLLVHVEGSKTEYSLLPEKPANEQTYREYLLYHLLSMSLPYNSDCVYPLELDSAHT